MSKIQVVVGGLYGSEAKGHIAGWLAVQTPKAVAIRVAGPNAGHSVVHPETGTKYALRQVPVAAVTNPDAQLIIAPGSEIDIAVLTNEIHKLEADGIKVRHRLTIDSNATVLESRHLEAEGVAGLTARIGSTGKGIGAARADRIMRTARTVRQLRTTLSQWAVISPVGPVLREYQRDSDTVIQVEGTQGYGLGLHTSFYPRVTSSDCTAIDFLAMAGINPWFTTEPWGKPAAELEIWVVFRPYPIRVAGNSGPMHKETTWDTLQLEPEYTTVTKKMRRVGHWDPHLAAMAIAANGGPRGPVHLALTMADQLDPALAGETDPTKVVASPKLAEFMSRAGEQLGQDFELVTTSDRTCVDLR